MAGTLEAMPTFQLYSFTDHNDIASKSISFSLTTPAGRILYGFSVYSMSGNFNANDLISITGMRFSQDEWMIACSSVGSHRDIPITDMYYDRGFGPVFDDVAQFVGNQFTVSLSELDDVVFATDELYYCQLYLGY